MSAAVTSGQAGGAAAGRRLQGAAGQAGAIKQRRIARHSRVKAHATDPSTPERKQEAQALAEPAHEQQSAAPAPAEHQQQPERSPLAMAAAAAALSAAGPAFYTALSTQPQLPPLSGMLVPAAALLLGGPLLAAAVAKAALGDCFHLELHRWACWGHVGGVAICSINQSITHCKHCRSTGSQQGLQGVLHPTSTSAARPLLPCIRIQCIPRLHTNSRMQHGCLAAAVRRPLPLTYPPSAQSLETSAEDPRTLVPVTHWLY